MTQEVIQIGEQAERPRIPHPPRGLRYLPTRLDEATCLSVIAQIDPDVDVSSLSAARSTINIAQLDDALTYTPLSINDKMRLKAALSDHGILSLGRKA